jgi:hypothetical protein
MNYYLVNAESEALKYESILNKEFMHMSMWLDFSPSLPNNDLAWWFGKGKYGVKNIDYTRLAKVLGPCE